MTLEQFEMWALDRLRVLAEIESSFVRNRSHEDLKTVVIQQQKKYLSLNSGTAQVDLGAERRKDHVSHFVLRLAFCRSEDLRKRFVKSEVMLFKIRFETDDKKEREDFMRSRNFGWVEVFLLLKMIIVVTHAFLGIYFREEWSREGITRLHTPSAFERLSFGTILQSSLDSCPRLG